MTENEEQPKYESHLTVEQKRAYMVDFEAFKNANLELSPGECMTAYYREQLEYSCVEIGKKFKKTSASIGNQYINSKVKRDKHRKLKEAEREPGDAEHDP